MTATARPADRLADHELLERIARHDETAFAELHRRFGPSLLRAARRLLEGTGVAPEDAVQDVYVRVHRHVREGGRAPATLGAWLHVVLRNRTLDLRRAAAVRPTGPLLVDPVAAHGDPAGVVLEQDAVCRAVRGVAALPERQRFVLASQALGGATLRELADELGTTPGAVKALLNRARATVAAVAA
jgi:RNA polymerase sigma-70 factor, ECF subfamily